MVVHPAKYPVTVSQEPALEKALRDIIAAYDQCPVASDGDPLHDAVQRAERMLLLLERQKYPVL